MSEDIKSSKRRRIASLDESPSLSTSAKSRAREAAAAAGSNEEKGGNGVGSLPSGGGRSSRYDAINGLDDSPSKKNSVRKGSQRKPLSVPVATEDEEEGLGESGSEDSDDEPRRSARKRKPSAKLLFIEKDILGAKKPQKIIQNGISRSEPQSVTKQKPSTLLSNTPLKSTKSAQSTPSKTPKRRGRPPKAQEEAKEATEEQEPLAVPSETPKKRGRPPGSTNKKSLESTKLIPTPKALRFDLPVAKTNGNVQEPEHLDVEMIDDVIDEEDKSIAIHQQAIASDILQKFGQGEFPTLALSKVVLEKLAQRRPIPLTNLDEEYSKVHTLLESTVTAGEGNSMLIVGARGSGKTALVNKALIELTKDQKEYFHVVRLNGFMQTDDKLALREIWRQLGREMEIDKDINKSYADTLTMLLALLSHPDEIAGETVDRVAKSIIIIMDEFDLFATHARQTLLYNLLDIAQSRKAPIAVLGLTTKFDVTERLEKRVKSRFSHRYVHLPLSKSLKAFQDVCKAAVSLQLDELPFEEQVAISQTLSNNQNISKGKLELADCLQAWNASVNSLFLDESFHHAYIRSIFHLTKSVPAVLTSLLLPFNGVARRDPESSTSLLPVENFLAYKPSSHLQAPTSSLALILPSLSELQLSLLIAAARLDVIHDSDTCSFGMAYAQYVELAGKARLHSAAAGALATGAGARVWGRDVARGEWEVLIRRGLLFLVSEAGGAGAVASVGGLVKVDVRLEEISGAVKGMSSVMERWCKQI